MIFRPMHILTIFFFVLVTSLGAIPEADAQQKRGGFGSISRTPRRNPQTPSGGAQRGARAVMGNYNESGGGPATTVDVNHDHEPQEQQWISEINSGVELDAVSASPRGGATVRCNLEGTPLSPQLERLVAQFCPPENAGQAGYCACVKRYIASNQNLSAMAQAREEDMHRIGYQFFLEEWAKEYGASILAFGSSRPDLKGPDVLSNMPNNCKPAVMMNAILSQIGNDNECQGNTTAFTKALNKYFRVDGSPEGVYELNKSATDQDWSDLHERVGNYNRFYARPGVAPGDTSHPRDFIDCMSPSDKRAYALLPVAWELGSLSKPGTTAVAEAAARSANLIYITQAITQIQEASDPALALKHSPELEKIRSVLEIFPGMEDLIMYGSLSKPAMGEVLTSLQGFLSEIRSPDFMNLSEAKVSIALMERMSAAVNSVKQVVSTKLQSVNTDNSFVERINNNCENMSKDLGKIACEPEDFIHSSRFMQVAFVDAASKGTRGYGRTSPPLYTLCSNRELLATATPDQLAGCMGYHSAQCSSLRNKQDREVGAETSQPVLESLQNRDLTNTGALQSMLRNRNAAQSIQAAEEGVAHTMCADFNKYLRETGCVNSVSSSDDFRRCSVGEKNFDKYIAAGGDSYLNNVSAPNSGTPAAALNGKNTANTPRQIASNDGDGFVADPGTVPATVSVDNSSSSSVSGTLAPGITTPNSPRRALLDIDTPAEIQAAIQQRVQRNEELKTEIEKKDTDISVLGTDNESARLRTELESLRAEMVAERERNTREIAELRNRPNAPEAVVRADNNSADDEEPGATTRRTDVRSSGIAGGAGNAQAQGFNIGGGRTPASAPETSISGDFSKASVSTNFGTAGATRGGLIQAAQSLPAVQSQDPNARLSLRVGDASYPVSDVQSIPLLPGKQLSRPEDIAYVIGEQNKLEKIPVDAQNRAFVEIREPVAPFNSIVVYVRITESGIEFLDANQPTPEGSDVPATLRDLEYRLSQVVPQS